MATGKKLVMAATGVAFVSLGIARVEPATAVTITFDDIGSHGDLITGNEYINQGIVFSRPAEPAAPPTGGTSAPGETIPTNPGQQTPTSSGPQLGLRLGATCSDCSQPNSLGNDNTFPGDFNGDVIGQFTNNSYATDLALTLFNPPYSVSAFDVNGNLLRTVQGNPVVDPNVPGQRFDFSGLQVNRFETGGTFYALDDVTFSTPVSTPVPEPSSVLGTLAFGALGASLMLRHKLRK